MAELELKNLNRLGIDINQPGEGGGGSSGRIIEATYDGTSSQGNLLIPGDPLTVHAGDIVQTGVNDGYDDYFVEAVIALTSTLENNAYLYMNSQFSNYTNGQTVQFMYNAERGGFYGEWGGSVG